MPSYAALAEQIRAATEGPAPPSRGQNERSPARGKCCERKQQLSSMYRRGGNARPNNPHGGFSLLPPPHKQTPPILSLGVQKSRLPEMSQSKLRIAAGPLCLSSSIRYADRTHP